MVHQKVFMVNKLEEQTENSEQRQSQINMCTNLWNKNISRQNEASSLEFINKTPT